MSARTRMRALLVGGAIGLAAALAVPLPAAAHDGLASASPAEGETVTEAPSEIALTFTGVLLDLGEQQRSTAIQVRHDGRYYETDCPSLSDRTASAPIALGPAGEYEVLWQVVSSDGHPTSGTYTFSYQPAAGATTGDGAATPACGGAAAEEQAGGGGDDQLLIGLGVGIGAIALVGVVLAVVLGRRRRAPGDPGGDVESAGR